MLDILRKHASSWMIKLILGAIVVTFVFFFGYSSMRKAERIGRTGAKGQAVATVNGVAVSEAEYEFMLDQNIGRMSKTFKSDKNEPLPDFVRKIAESSTMQQLVSREIMLQLSDDLKLSIPDQELADAIRTAPITHQGEEFDPIFYRHEFLPYFKHRFGLDFEAFMLQDLKLGSLESTFANIDQFPTEKTPEDSATWTFESVTIDPNALVESKAMKSRDEAVSLAKMLLESDPKNWKTMLTAVKLAPKKVGPIKIRERATLLDGQALYEDYEKLFALTPNKPLLAEPIERGGKIFVVRLVEANTANANATPAWPTSDFFRSWMASLAEKAKVVSHLKQDTNAKP